MVTRELSNKLTIPEKFELLLRVPYLVSCAVWVVVLIEIPLIFNIYFIRREPVNIQGISYLVVLFLMFFYFPVSVRFLRRKLLEVRAKVCLILRDGDADFCEAFGRALSYRGQIITIIIIAAVAFYIISRSGSLVNGVINFVICVYAVTMLGSLVWFYLGCLAGLYQLAGKSFEFAPAAGDRHMGTRPIGLLCLSLSGAYFLGIILLILMTVTSPYFQVKSPPLIGLEAVLILVGLTMFFVPLYRMHLRMVEEKTRQEMAIQGQFDTSYDNLRSDSVALQLEKVQRSLGLLMAERKLNSISTWPFDTQILGRFLVFLISVIAGLVARYIFDLIQH